MAGNVMAGARHPRPEVPVSRRDAGGVPASVCENSDPSFGSDRCPPTPAIDGRLSPLMATEQAAEKLILSKIATVESSHTLLRLP
jgi:hypothetical protein